MRSYHRGSVREVYEAAKIAVVFLDVEWNYIAAATGGSQETTMVYKVPVGISTALEGFRVRTRLNIFGQQVAKAVGGSVRPQASKSPDVRASLREAHKRDQFPHAQFPSVCA